MPRKQQWAIPDDWDNETWFCSQVFWPDSVKWAAILVGCISLPARGRIWNPNTGIIVAAQEVGREIWARNFPLIECQDSPAVPCPQPETVYIFGTGYDDEENDPMNCRAPCIRWYNGILQVFDCGAWIDVPGVGEVPDVTGRVVDPVVRPDEMEAADLACRKAYAIGHDFHNFVSAVVDALDAVFWEAPHQIEQAGGWDCSYNCLLNLVLEYQIAYVLLSNFMEALDGFSTLERDRLICQWAKVISNDTTEVTEEDRSEMKAAIKGNNYGLVEDAFMIDCWDCYRARNMQAAATAGILNDDADCTCPGEEAPWLELDWYEEFDLTTISDPYSSITYGTFIQGLGFVSQSYGGGQLWGAQLDPEHTGGGSTTLEYMRIEVTGNWAWPAGGTRHLLQAVGGSAEIDLDDVSGGVGEWEGTDIIPADTFALQHNVVVGDFDVHQTITRIIVGGSGVNPFS